MLAGLLHVSGASNIFQFCMTKPLNNLHMLLSSGCSLEYARLCPSTCGTGVSHCYLENQLFMTESISMESAIQ